MTLVYRIQDFTGHGPWTSTEYSRANILVERYRKRWGKELIYASPSEMPTPWQDIPLFEDYDRRLDENYSTLQSTLSTFRCRFAERFRFGCLDLAQLHDWFYPAMRHILQWHGYRLFIFDSDEVYPGRTQCAFNPKTVVRVAVKSLTE